MDLIPLSWTDLALAASLLLVNGALGLVFRLRLTGTLVWAAGRMIVQVLLLGYVLDHIFALEQGAAVVALLVVMVGFAGQAAVARTRRRFRGIVVIGAAAMLAASFLVTFVLTAAVLRVPRWFEPRYVVPLCGMILGNCLNGVSLGLDRLMEGLERDRDRIETLLAHGATPAEARHAIVREAARTGMLPILNTMTVVGVVSIPGMMTGQILAGSPPLAAAQYQLLILFGIAAGTALGTLAAVLLAARRLFDDAGRLRLDRLRLARA